MVGLSSRQSALARSISVFTAAVFSIFRRASSARTILASVFRIFSSSA